MSVAERFSDDLKKAIKSGDNDALLVIRIIKATIKNREIEKGSPLNDEEIYNVLQSLVRQGRESLEQFSQGDRADLAEREKRHLSIVQSYLPQQLPEKEINRLIKEVIHDTGAKGPGEMGKVMKAIIPKVTGQADNKLVSELVKKALAGHGSEEK
ncbi:MAG: GatB/YqeY domain-containing protein [Nitrospiraceae bacterium]|nr:MAG: GatB/YqeY domain-containing protein [Nitrospiraceae bacterium]